MDVVDLVGDLSQRLADRREPAPEALAPVRGHEHDPPLERDGGQRPRRDVVRPCDDVLQRVDHGVAGDVDARGIDALAEQIPSRPLRRREVGIGEEIDDTAVRLFRERTAPVAGA